MRTIIWTGAMLISQAISPNFITKDNMLGILGILFLAIVVDCVEFFKEGKQ